MTYENALRILNEYGEGSVWTQHCLAVSHMAEHLSQVLTRKFEINIEFLRCASLLHDIGRYRSHDPIMHGVEGYNLLNALSYSEEAFVCTVFPEARLLNLDYPQSISSQNRHSSFFGLHLWFSNHLNDVGAASAAQLEPMCG